MGTKYSFCASLIIVPDLEQPSNLSLVKAGSDPDRKNPVHWGVRDARRSEPKQFSEPCLAAGSAQLPRCKQLSLDISAALPLSTSAAGSSHENNISVLTVEITELSLSKKIL